MDDDDNNSPPECGAIFISNSTTKTECFDRHVFALPSSRANFVKLIKSGMILFLFDYEKRKLYGVFQATTDGKMDIVPNGFRYSGRRFPAQVRFKTMWFCHPLSEKEFKEAIRDNYFSNNKFRFGLSEFQVRRLLSLFNSKKVKKNPPYRVPEHVKDLRYVGCDDLKRRDRGFTEDDDYKLSSDYQVDSFLRTKECELMKRGAVNDGTKVYSEAQDLWTDNYDGFLTKKRRLDYQDRLLYRDLAENENYADRGMSRSSCISSPIEVRRSMDCQRLVTIDRRYNENQEYMLNPVNTYPTESLEPRRADYDQYMQRNCLFSDPNFGESLNDQYSNLLNNYAIEGNVLRNDDRLLKDCNTDRVKPLVCSDRDFDLVAQAMNRTYNHHHLLNEELESRYQVCNDGSPFTASEPFTSHFHRARRSSVGGMFPDYNRIEGEQGFVTPITGSSPENFSRPLDIERRMFYDRKIRLAEERVIDKMFEIGLTSTNCSSSGGSVENVDDVPTCIGRAMSKYHSPFSKPQHIFSSSEKSIPETRIISTELSVSQNHRTPSSTFDDPTTTVVADPCICELTRAAERCHASEAADWDSSFRQESHPYSFSKSSASQILSEPFKCSKFMDQELQRAIPLTKSFNSNLSEHGDPHTCTPVDGNLYTPNGQLQTSSPYVSDHATCNNHMESKKDIICSEAKNISQVIDLSSKEHQKVSEASTQSDPSTTRRSVFTRLKRPQVDEDRNDGGFNDFDHCMEASADKEVMETLLPGNTLPLRMPNDPKVVAEPKKPVSFDLNKRHPQCQIDLTTHSTSEEKNLNDSLLSNEESVDELPKESRVVDFKRRSKKKSLVVTTFESATDITVPKIEAGNPTRRRKLVRPLFGKTEAAPKIIGSNTAVSKALELTHVDDKQNYQVQIVSNCKSEIRIDDASLSSHEYPHDKKNNPSEEKQKYLVVETRGLQVTRVGDDKQNCQTSISNDKSEVQIDDASLISHEFPHDKKNNRSKEQMYLGAENCSLQVTGVGDDKQIDDVSHASPDDKKTNYAEELKDLEVENCSLQVTHSISNVKSEVQIGNTSISSHESPCDKINNHSEKQKDLGVGNFSLQMTRVGKQNSQSNHKGEVQVDDASLGRHESSHDKKNDHSEEQKDLGVENCSLLVTRVGNDKQNCGKGISNDIGDVQNDNAGLSCHESPHDQKNNHSEEQMVLGFENRSLQVQHEKTTMGQNCSLENSTILPKEVDSTVESLKHEEPSLEKLKPDASCSSNSREGRKSRLVRRIVKKIEKIRKAKVCPGKGQNFNNEKDKPTSENSQGKS